MAVAQGVRAAQCIMVPSVYSRLPKTRLSWPNRSSVFSGLSNLAMRGKKKRLATAANWLGLGVGGVCLGP